MLEHSGEQRRFKTNLKHTMRKAVSLSLGFILLAVPATPVPAQTNSPMDMAVTEAVLRQANTIVLRQKLVDAKSAAARGDLVTAAKFYQEAYTLVQQVGSGIDVEKAQTISGLASTRLTLARRAQSQGDLHEADTEVNQVLKVDPQNTAALAFKRQNDQMLAAMKGKMPDKATLQEVPYIVTNQIEAGTLVRDGKLLYEMGKLEEAETKLSQALENDPDNVGAYYYLNLIKQARYSRAAFQHTVDTQSRMAQVEKKWVQPTPRNPLPTPNPYAETNLTYTGPGRGVIENKLNRIRLDNISFDGLPLSEVVRQLSERARLSDPEKEGINFLINPNPDVSGAAAGSGASGGVGAAATLNPATGLPEAPSAAAGGEMTPVDQVMIKLNLTHVRLADVLDALVMVADHPIKYSILDYGIVFASKGAETPQLYMRTFKVDPNTFYSGLESVSSASFGAVNSSGGTGGGGGGGGGSQNFSSVIAVVNASPGAAGFRNTGTGGGGGGGGGAQGAANPLSAAGAAGGGAAAGQGGLRSITTVNLASDVSVVARSFFTTLGVNMDSPPGKSVFFNDRLGLLFVRATLSDLDTIERAIQALNQVAPQVHIKSRFIEVLQDDQSALGFDWYLGNFINGSVVANGGSAPSLNVPVSTANPLGAFPGNSLSSLIPSSSGDQVISGPGQTIPALRNSLNAPALATITGILTDPNFRVVLHALSQRSGTETLAEPEVVTTSGRQTQMRATRVIQIITGFSFQQGTAATTTTGTGATP